MADEEVPIIIIKKGGGHGGHHGGAWKIAYADFVTAMMAFFMVMWLVNSAEVTTKQSIASYFRRPGMFDHGHGTPLEMGSIGILNDSYAPPKPQDSRELPWQVREKLKDEEHEEIDKPLIQANGLAEQESKDSINLLTDENSKSKKQVDKIDFIKPSEITNIIKPYDGKTGKTALKAKLQDLSRDFSNFLHSNPDLEEVLGKIEVQVESDGLVLEIMDTAKRSMFGAGSARVLPEAYPAFKVIVTKLKSITESIEIRGHTDAAPFAAVGGYSNWELSLARANEARKLIQEFGFEEKIIKGIVGKASNELKDLEDPSSPSNRRITMKLFSLDSSLLPKSISDTSKTKQIPQEKEANKEKNTASQNENSDKIITNNSASKKSDKISIEEIIKESKRNSKLRLPKPKEQYPEASPEIFADQPVLGSKDVF
jgi:chemotaxis protein MotB